MMTSHYFDYAAATPLDESVRAAMTPFEADKFHNPSALYLAAQASKQALEAARKQVAAVLGCKAPEVIFTAGGTESDNLAIQGVMRSFPGATCIVSAIEHDAVLRSAELFSVKTAAVTDDGRVDVERLSSLIDDTTVLVSVMYANNEVGTIQPLAKVAQLIKAARADRLSRGIALPLYFHTDACQAANYLPLLVNTLGVDLMTLNGGKLYGPKQSGILFVRSGTQVQPLILGGGQERGYRSGTENVAACVGFAAALEQAQQRREAESARLSSLREAFMTSVQAEIPGSIINGSLAHRLPNNIHLTLPGRDNERLLMELDEQGFQVATGSACSASSDEPSHVLTALGLSDEAARASLRITFGRQTTEKAVNDLLSALVAVSARA